VLAWTNLVIQNNWYDKAYIDRYATGFSELAASVKQYTPEWAAKETDISAETIVETARLIGINKPASASIPDGTPPGTGMMCSDRVLCHPYGIARLLGQGRRNLFSNEGIVPEE